MFNKDLSISDLSTRGLRITYPNDIIRTHVSYREFGDMYSPSLGFSRRNGFKRILSCHPIKILGGGEGFDPVKKKK